MIVGGSGSGKTTLAMKLGKITNLPLHFMDQMFWEPNWVQRNDEEMQALLTQTVAMQRWIIEGNNSSSFPDRVLRADAIIFLDLPTGLRLWRVISRTVRYWKKTRPAFTENCPERFDLKFMKLVFFYRSSSRPKVLTLITTAPAATQIIHLKTRKCVHDFLHGFQETTKSFTASKVIT